LRVLNPDHEFIGVLDSMNFIIDGIEDQVLSVAGQFELHQNYPNPFNPTTQIEYLLKKTSPIILKIYDISGSEIKTLVNQNQTAGKYSISFNASNLSSGIYIYMLQAGQFSQSRKMLLLR
jgi:hypothetical protein